MRLAILLLSALFSRDAYVLITPHGQISNGGSIEHQELRAIREAHGSNVFWFRHGGKEYVVTNRPVVAEIADLFRPQAKLGEQQAALGEKQAALGEQQARLGMQQVAASSARQNELGRKQNELGRQQNALGQQQNVLGRKQNALAKEIEKKLSVMIPDLIQRGIARQLKRY